MNTTQYTCYYAKQLVLLGTTNAAILTNLLNRSLPLWVSHPHESGTAYIIAEHFAIGVNCNAKLQVKSWIKPEPFSSNDCPLKFETSADSQHSTENVHLSLTICVQDH